MINPRTGTTVWYYPTATDKVEDILEKGLFAFERSSFTGGIHTPWIYLTTQPETVKGIEYLAVDVGDIHEDCLSMSQLENSAGDKLLRVHVDIPAKSINKI